MHESMKRNVEHHMETWRRSLASSGAIQDWQLDELEDHLRTAYDSALLEFASEPLAWAAALERTGSQAAITKEFSKGQMMSWKSKFAGLVITVSMLALVLETGPGGVSLFIHIPSMIFVCAIVLGGLVSSFGPTRIVHAAQASLAGASPLEASEVASLVQVFQRAHRLAWMSGVIGFILGFVQVLQNLSDPSGLGQGLATCLFCMLYGSILAEVVIANGRQWLENRQVPASVV